MRPHGTYSIVALDPATGELGAAVQSHWFSVGSLCTWARPGIGAVATQSVVEPAHGPHALDRLAAGEDAPRRARAAARAPTRSAPCARSASSTRAARRRPHRRRLHPVRGRRDRRALGLPGQHDGPRHRARRRCRRRSSAPSGDLAERLMAALEAAEAEGGDVRGRQSAALLVAPARGRAVAGADRPARRGPRRPDRRAAPPARPPARLRAGRPGRRADGRAAAPVEAGALYARAAELAPQSDELLFWAGLALAHGGDVDGGRRRRPPRRAVHPGWAHAARAALAGLRPGRRRRCARRSARLLALAGQLRRVHRHRHARGRARCG